MANPTAANTVAGKPLVTGGILYAPTGTALPTDAVTALNAAFAGCGYATEGGLTGSEKRDNKEIMDWSGLQVASLLVGVKATFKFGFLEFLNDVTAKAIYGDSNVSVTAANGSHGRQVAVTHNVSEGPHKSWIFAMGHGAKKVRIVIPDGQITEVDDVDYKTDSLIARNVTLTAYPDSSGNLYYEYTDDGTVTAVPSISGVSPAGQSVGELVTISGTSFTGTTGVTIDGETAAFLLLSDSQISAVIPEAAAGAAAVIVTNATGASSPYAYTVV